MTYFVHMYGQAETSSEATDASRAMNATRADHQAASAADFATARISLSIRSRSRVSKSASHARATRALAPWIVPMSTFQRRAEMPSSRSLTHACTESLVLKSATDSLLGIPVCRASILEVELPLQRADDLSDVGAVRATVGHDSHRPVGAAFIWRYSDDAASVNVGLLASKAGERLNALYQHLLQLLGGSGGLSHRYGRISGIADTASAMTAISTAQRDQRSACFAVEALPSAASVLRAFKRSRVRCRCAAVFGSVSGKAASCVRARITRGSGFASGASISHLSTGRPAV
ncbi:hypothetical protein VVAX_03593 [Variovorax paradoxus]|uniref:Uncharacterized protein n=1 Tax=Variovorax paradoxus TaxID=34073 RepID=A0A679JBN5_VARPD|nr:hypothetical protein VVAX_03593 [Variovorax paradoxus]